MIKPTIINADKLVVGRMASYIAKRLLEGEEIIVVNAEKAVYTGKKKSKVKDAKKFLEVGHPRMGPFHYRQPDKIVRKSVRGMIPTRKAKGKLAYKRLKVYIGVPEELKELEFQTVPNAAPKKSTYQVFSVGDYAKEIGWNCGE